MKLLKPLILMLSICIFAMYGCSSNSETENANQTSDFNVDKESAKDTLCYITKIFEDHNNHYITVDYINVYSGKEAEEYC